MPQSGRLLVAGIGNLSFATSLAEFLSAYPTAGGQYHWVAIVSPRAYAPFLAWLSGWITLFGWIAVTASGNLLGSQLILGIVVNKKKDEVGNLPDFLMYLCVTLIAFAVNLGMSSRLPSLNKVALIASIIGVVIIPAISSHTADLAGRSRHLCLRDSLTRRAGQVGITKSYCWEFLQIVADPSRSRCLAPWNSSGRACAQWLRRSLSRVRHGGIIPSILRCSDGRASIKEIPDASNVGPRVMIGCVVMGAFTGFCFIVAILFPSGGAPRLTELSILH